MCISGGLCEPELNEYVTIQDPIEGVADTTRTDSLFSELPQNWGPTGVIKGLVRPDQQPDQTPRQPAPSPPITTHTPGLLTTTFHNGMGGVARHTCTQLKGVSQARLLRVSVRCCTL